MDQNSFLLLTPPHPLMPTPDAAHPILPVMVAVSYLVQTITVLLIIWQGFRAGSYGMPIFGVVAFTVICVICGFMGPLQPQLFREFLTHPYLVWMWRAFTLLMLVVFLQYFLTAPRHPTLWPEVAKYRVVLSILLFAIFLYGAWTFVVFYQDVYINELWPLCMLVVSANYVTTLFTRPRLRGLSLSVAIGWAVSNSLLYGATVLGNMDDPYPCHNGVCEIVCGFGENAPTCTIPQACPQQSCNIQVDTGYEFIYFIYSITIGLNLAYIAGLVYRRHELKEGWDVDRTLKRMLPG